MAKGGGATRGRKAEEKESDNDCKEGKESGQRWKKKVGRTVREVAAATVGGGWRRHSNNVFQERVEFQGETLSSALPK